MCLAGGALWLLYIRGARARSRTVGLMAALFFAAMPRVFYQSHLDCFDIPIVTMWCLCAYAYWRSIERGGFGWALATGILFGLALKTKHNSWFLPFAVLTHAVLARGTKGLRDVRAGTVRVPPRSFSWPCWGRPCSSASGRGSGSTPLHASPRTCSFI